MTSGGGGCRTAGKLQELKRLWRILNDTQKKKLVRNMMLVLVEITWFLTKCALIKQC